MTRSELTTALAERCDLTRGDARQVVATVLDGMVEALCAGQRVEIRGFGTLRPRHYPPYAGRNPRTGSRVDVPRKVLPAFRPGKALVERVDPPKED